MLSRAVIISLLGASAIAGCAWTPGNNLDTSNMKQTDVVTTADDTYLVQQITPEVILRQDLADKQALMSQDKKLAIDVGDPAAFTYKLMPQDILSIVVWDHPELTAGAGNALDSTVASPVNTTQGSTPYSQNSGGGGGSNDPLGYTITPSGTIFFPYAGVIRIGGDTVEQARVRLTRALSRYIANPQVTVRVLAYRSQQVQLTGELKTPGTLSITDHPLTLADAIARAGGATTTGDLHLLRLTRHGKSVVVDAYAMLNRGDMSQNILLQGGDIVNVPDQIDSRVFVMGEVIHPSTLYMNQGRLSLADVLTGAQGIDSTAANVRQVYVFRPGATNPTDPQIFQLDMTQPSSILLAAQFKMSKLDVVYVGTAKGVLFNRVLNLVTPTLSNAFYLQSLLRNR